MKNSIRFSLAALILMAVMCCVNPIYAQKKVKYVPPTEVQVTFDSEPQGAKVVVGGKVVGRTPLTTTIPVSCVLSGMGRNWLKEAEENCAIEVKYLLDGYQPADLVLKPTITADHYDLYKGFPYIFNWPKALFQVLEPDDTSVTSAAYANDGSIPQGEAQKVVNRDRPGQTALERTIIRWYFESQPQGARIFWRVISSCPDQVKNTNELWLGNTPFEETRSFNIQGLTYENSRDVQIEIKVKRAGYLDQTKRFNVRQAIDQQEISSFFDMIKTEE